MKKFVVKRPTEANPKIWEWMTNMPIENSTYVDLVKFDTREEAETAATEWSSESEVVEITVPD